jgi:exodeoxyribonuclease VII small subunit
MTDAAPAEPAASTDGLRYADAMAELDAILHELERGDVDLDRLAGQVRRAADLVRFCRGRLDDTRTEVTRIVTDLDAGLDPQTDDRAAP